MINSAFGTPNIAVFSGAASSTAGFSAMLLDLRGETDALSAAELTNVANFIASGRRVLFIGDNTNFTSWNDSFLGLFGASSTGGSNAGTPLLANAITQGVAQIDAIAPGAIVGGTQLFSNGMAALFGPSNNVLASLDVNICRDGQGLGQVDNTQYCENMANWLAGGRVVATPEPATGLLLIAGLALVATVYRRREIEGL